METNIPLQNFMEKIQVEAIDYKVKDGSKTLVEDRRGNYPPRIFFTNEYHNGPQLSLGGDLMIKCYWT